jgi:hypothetical protein
MDQDAIMKGMATRLVEDMDPEKAKAVLLAVVSGQDLHEAILGDVPAAEPKLRRKRGGGRKRKAITPETENDENEA